MTDPQFILCPYCGNAQPSPANQCDACRGYFDSLSRKVTQQHMGPWFIRDTHQPFRPGCSYAVILNYLNKGLITADTILRGPTTRQFWSVAHNVPGVAHHLGFCHKCQKPVEPDAVECPHCDTRFPLPDDREALGLARVDPRIIQQASQPRGQQTEPQSQPSIQRSEAAQIPRAIILDKTSLPSPPPSAGSLTQTLDLNPAAAAAPPAITTLGHPITTNPTQPLPHQGRFTRLEWIFITLNIILVVVIAVLFLPSLFGTSPAPPQNTSSPLSAPPLPDASNTSTPGSSPEASQDFPNDSGARTSLPSSQLPASTFPTPLPTATPGVSEPSSPEDPETVQQALNRGDKKAALALLNTRLASLPGDITDEERKNLEKQIDELQKQIELESFFTP